jgi:hypothetical protein
MMHRNTCGHPWRNKNGFWSQPKMITVRCCILLIFFLAETTWAQIQAAQSFIQIYGIPFKYHVDSLLVFRFVQGHDSVWRNHVLQIDDVNTKLKKVMQALSVEVTHALSIQTKGKIEIPYRW